MSDDFTDVDDLLSQLAANKQAIVDHQRSLPEVNSDNLGDFLIKSSVELITKTLAAIDAIQDRILAATDAEEVESLASVLKASAGAIEILNKLHISNERNKTVKEVKDKEINARLTMNTEDNQTRVTLTRDEMMANLLSHLGSQNKSDDQQEIVTVQAKKSLAKEQFVDIDVDSAEIL